MATEQDHIALANRNHDALCALLNARDDHPEWIATIAFYKALQIVEAVLGNCGKGHCNGHQKRLDILRDKSNRFDCIFKPYKKLLEASEVARYLGGRGGGAYSSFSDYMPMEAVKSILLAKSLHAVETHSRQFLSEDAKRDMKQISAFLASLQANLPSLAAVPIFFRAVHLNGERPASWRRSSLISCRRGSVCAD